MAIKLSKQYRLNQQLKVMALVSLTLSVSINVLMPQLSAHAARRNSRLSQLVRQKPSLYKPTRLFVGEDNKVIVRAPAGNTVVLVMSSQPGKTKAPNGQLLQVNTEHKALKQTATEKGVAVFEVPVPDNERLAGQALFLHGYTYSAEDYADLEVLSLVGPTGRPVNYNGLEIQVRSSGEGTMLMPGMPGMSASMLRRLSTIGEVSSDDRKKELVDDGDIDRDNVYDQNTFLVRPDGTGGLGGP